MKRSGWLALAVAVFALALPVLAGEKGTKCPMATQDCLNKMAQQMKTTGWIGVDLDKEKVPGELVISRVFPGTPAEAAGIQPGDVLYALEGVPLTESNNETLKKLKKEWTPGKDVTYTIKRSGREMKIALKLAPMPADVIARIIGEHMLDHANAVNIAAK